MAPCWNCVDLLSVASVIIIIHSGLPQTALPFCLTVEKKTLSTCGWQEERNEHILCLRLAILGDSCKINGLFTLFTLSPPPLNAAPLQSLFYKRTWHLDPDEMVILRY